jgi:hypothetical protein
MWQKRAIFAAITGVLALVVFLIRGPSSGIREVADEAVQLHLRLTASSIYEYHAATGKWPTQIGDLATTSLPAKSPHWKYQLDNELIVVVWHKTLNPDPKDNAGHILAYYNKGLISEQGQSWVCWGDLRTEYIKTDDLRDYLKKPQ